MLVAVPMRNLLEPLTRRWHARWNDHRRQRVIDDLNRLTHHRRDHERSIELAMALEGVARVASPTHPQFCLEPALTLVENELPDTDERKLRILRHLIATHDWHPLPEARILALCDRALAAADVAYRDARLDVLQRVADLYAKHGRLADGIALWKDALEIWSRGGGLDDTSSVALALDRLLTLNHDARRHADAEAAGRRLIAMQDDWHWRFRLGTMHRLAVAVARQRRPGDAEPLLRGCLAILEKAHGSDDPYIARCVRQLANLCARSGKTAEAAALRARAAALRAAASFDPLALEDAPGMPKPWRRPIPPHRPAIVGAVLLALCVVVGLVSGWLLSPWLGLAIAASLFSLGAVGLVALLLHHHHLVPK